MRLFALLVLLVSPPPALAQAHCHGSTAPIDRDRDAPVPSGLASTFDGLFSFFLSDALRLAGAPGQHGTHYLEAACIAERVLVPALSNFIAANVTAFPSSTPQVGVTYDFSSGAPVRQVESLGPIFSETPSTIGRHRLTLGANVSALTLDHIRGDPLSGVAFNFVHQDAGGGGIGDDPLERDLLVVRPRLNVDAVIYGLFANYGLTDRVEVGVAIPVVTVALEGRAEAEIFAYSGGDPSVHFFGGTSEEPLLEEDYRYEMSETFVPAVELRTKVHVPAQGSSLGVLGVLSVPTSAAGSLLGEREFGGRLAVLGSTRVGPVGAHVNLGYDRRGTAGDPDAALATVGLDANLSPTVNVAASLLGALTVGEPTRFYDVDAELGAPGAVVQYVIDDTAGALGRVEEPFSSIDDGTDTTVLLSLGSRFAPTETVQGFFNVLVPVVRGGLQSTLVPTFGVSFDV
ncbi:hypothetical protein [Rubrivirga sp. IMCC45206]|uniref:hypothetical protein n=1 Tax=Rubrivirga sp. IMCC45206 TaxID=3391614 RepID=UPI00398FC333